MTEVFINNKRLDLDEQTVSQTFQLSDVADLSTKQTSFTNRLKAPKTPNNIEIFDEISLYRKYELTGGDAVRFPYGTPAKAKIVEDGIEITTGGFVQLFKVSKYFEFAIYGTERTFFDLAKKTTLQDCFDKTLTSFLLPFTLENYIDSTDNFIFAACRQNNCDLLSTNNRVMITPYVTPLFYVKDLFERVFIHLGYSLNYPIVNGASLETLDTWKTFVVTAGTPMAKLGKEYGDQFFWYELAPKMTVDVFLREIMIRYNLTLRTDELNKTIEFISMDELIRNGEVEDWSDKFDSVESDEYNFKNYGQETRLKYGDDEFDELTGSFDLINKNLKEQSDIFVSKYKKPFYIEPSSQYLFADLVGGDLVVYPMIDIQDCELNPIETSPGVVGDYEIESVVDEVDFHFFNVKKVDVINFRHSFTTADVSSFYNVDRNYVYVLQYEDRFKTFIGGSGTPVLTQNDTTSFQIFIDEYWKYTTQLLNRMHKAYAKMIFNTIDIHQLDFFKLKYIKQLGGLFYLNKVSSYKKGKLTDVELIKIPSLIN